MKLSERIRIRIVPGQPEGELERWAVEAQKLESDNAAMRTALGPLARLADLYEREAFEGQFAYLAAIGCKRARDVIEEVKNES